MSVKPGTPRASPLVPVPAEPGYLPTAGLVVLGVSRGTPFPMGVAEGSHLLGLRASCLTALASSTKMGDGNTSWGSVMFSACIQGFSTVADTWNAEENQNWALPYGTQGWGQTASREGTQQGGPACAEYQPHWGNWALRED